MTYIEYPRDDKIWNTVFDRGPLKKCRDEEDENCQPAGEHVNV